MSRSDTPPSKKPEKVEDKHSRALDGLRWWAFFAVFLFHFHEDIYWYGRYGVTVFFALSGFLIGRILIREREAPGVTVGGKLKAFYGRRFLRIFPLYYFLLLMILILGKVGILKEPRFEALPFHALYLTNFYMFFTGMGLDSQTHLWSLAVEEHFYLFVPFLILLAPIRRLEIGIAILAIVNLILRAVNLYVWHLPSFEYLSPLEFDILCMGVAAALIEQRGSFLGLTGDGLTRIGKICAIPLLLLIVINCVIDNPGFYVLSTDVLLPSLFGVCSAALVYAFWTRRIPQGITRLFTWAPLAYLGGISYGLYVYHNFSFVLTRHGILATNRNLGGVAALIGTIVVASLSWYILERPINNLKNRFFPYPKIKSPAQG